MPTTKIIQPGTAEWLTATKACRYVIGIDCGVNTGFAVWDRKHNAFEMLGTTTIHRAIELVIRYMEHGEGILVRVEDARKRKWFGNAGREQLQGAGSVKRDAKIWEDFLNDKGILFEMVPPANNRTKLNAEAFEKYTTWTNRTSEHARDAAMLAFKR